MPKFRKRPVEVEAFQWDGRQVALSVNAVDAERIRSAPDHTMIPVDRVAIKAYGSDEPEWFLEAIQDGRIVVLRPCLLVQTPSCPAVANIGDIIICHPDGEIRVCKPDVFEKTYEPADQRSALSQLLEVCKATRDLIPREEWPDIEPTWEEWRDAGIRLETAIANYENACEPADQPVTEEVPRIHHFDTEKLKEALSLFVRPGGELWSLKDGQLCQRLDWTVEEAIAFVAGKMLEKGVRMAVIASGQFEDATGA